MYSPKKILVVANDSWNIYNYRLKLIDSLLDAGHSVSVVAPEGKYSDELRAHGLDLIPVKMDRKGSNPFKDLLLIITLFLLYRKHKPDAVLHFTIKPNIYGSIAAGLLKVPAINNVSGLGTIFIKESLMTKIAKMLYKIAFRFPHCVFFQNPDDKELFLDHNMINEDISDLLPGSGVCLEKYQPEEAIKQNPFTFLFVGRMLRDKGIYELIEAIELLRPSYPDVKFQLLGNIDEGNRTAITEDELIEWEADELIEYLGFKKNVKPYKINCDCLVLPSYREGTPRTLLEGAAMEKPIVTTDVPGCREVVDHGINGFLCKVKDPVDLANKLETMINLPENKRIEMGRQGRLKMQNTFDEKIVIQKYIDVIEDIFNNNKDDNFEPRSTAAVIS